MTSSLDHGAGQPHPAVDSIRKDGLVPLLSSSDPEVLWRAAQAIVESGLSVMEVALRATGTLEALGQLIHRVETSGIPVTVGAGTVLDVAAADAAIGAGARFVFSPVMTPAVGERCRAGGVAWFPGCATPTEVQTAIDLGCDAVKLFPADAIGGPAFLRSIRSVFPHARAIPSGGVVPSAEELFEWFDAGAIAVGVGSWLFPTKAIAANDWVEVQDRLTSAVSAVAIAKGEREQ